MATTKTIDVDGGVLVGHDGSDFSDQALRWALDYASTTGESVTVARAWVLTTAPRPESWEPGYMPPLDDFAEAVVVRLRADIAEVVADYPGIDIQVRAVHGKPATRIIEASDKVSMIVLGRRGLGGFKGLVLGSVSEQIVRHAQSTVVIVQPTEIEASPERRNVLDAEFDDA